MAPPYPPSHIVPPKTPHTHTVIFLHGLGSNATEFCSEIFESQDSSDKFFTQLFPGIKWVFPCAPFQHASLEDEEGRQWFDITSFQNPQEDSAIQRSGLYESRQRLLTIIGEEAKEVGMEKVIVAGISQGCATAIYTLLTVGLRVGGFVGLCGWLPLTEDLQKEFRASERARDMATMPILLQHNVDDSVVPVENGKLMHTWLEKMGMGVDWQQFDKGGHWLNEPEGMDGIVEFVRSVMAGSK